MSTSSKLVLNLNRRFLIWNNYFLSCKLEFLEIDFQLFFSAGAILACVLSFALLPAIWSS